MGKFRWPYRFVPYLLLLLLLPTLDQTSSIGWTQPHPQPQPGLAKQYWLRLRLRQRPSLVQWKNHYIEKYITLVYQGKFRKSFWSFFFLYSMIQQLTMPSPLSAVKHSSHWLAILSSQLYLLWRLQSHVGIDYTEIGSTSTKSCHQGQFLTLHKYYNIHIGDGINIKIGKREIVSCYIRNWLDERLFTRFW